MGDVVREALAEALEMWESDLRDFPISPHANRQLRNTKAALSAYEEQQKRMAELEGALTDAIECVESWGAYASDYFQDKHGLADDLARLRARRANTPIRESE